MAVSETVIAAYIRCYNPAQLLAALNQALADRTAGVLVTQVNFQDGGGSGVPITGDPNELIEILEICLQRTDNPEATGQKPISSVMNFNSRRSET
ncbi:MAG: hypothetical protein ABIT37_01685 [Luteolibacter sp.]